MSCYNVWNKIGAMPAQIDIEQYREGQIRELIAYFGKFETKKCGTSVREWEENKMETHEEKTRKIRHNR